jgi:dynein heavy chain
MLDGDVEKCIEDLRDSITCGRKWRAIYDKMAATINKKTGGPKWDFSSNSIFAQVEAFVQRCS